MQRHRPSDLDCLDRLLQICNAIFVFLTSSPPQSSWQIVTKPGPWINKYVTLDQPPLKKKKLINHKVEWDSTESNFRQVCFMLLLKHVKTQTLPLHCDHVKFLDASCVQICHHPLNFLPLISTTAICSFFTANRRYNKLHYRKIIRLGRS